MLTFSNFFYVFVNRSESEAKQNSVQILKSVNAANEKKTQIDRWMDGWMDGWINRKIDR